MPCDELAVQVRAILSTKQWCLGKDVLNLCSNLTKLNVFNYWKNAGMFAYDILQIVSLVKQGAFRIYVPDHE